MIPSPELSDRIDDLVDEWHDTALGEASLPDYLGLTPEQYAEWLRDGVLPDGYEFPGRDGHGWLWRAVAIVAGVYLFAEALGRASRTYLTGGR